MLSASQQPLDTQNLGFLSKRTYWHIIFSQDVPLEQEQKQLLKQQELQGLRYGMPL